MTIKNLSDIKPGEGAIIEMHGKKVATYLSDNNEAISLSPFCTHMGCQVDWNSKSKTWDCPCHGASYTKEGHVINGPAKKDLEKIA